MTIIAYCYHINCTEWIVTLDWFWEKMGYIGCLGEKREKV